MTTTDMQAVLTPEQRKAIQECIDYLAPAAREFSDLGMPGMGGSKHARCIRTLRALLASRPDAQADERGARLYRFIEAPEHILAGDEIWAQRSSEWQPVTPDFVDTEYSNWMPPIRRVVDQHEKSDLYKAGYLAGKKAAQESLSKLVSCDPNDEALGLICEALSLKPEGDITEAILGAIEELKTEAAQGVSSEWRELCRRLYVELFHRDQQMRSTRDQDGEPHWTQSVVVCDVLKDAKAALAALSPDREQVGEAGEGFTPEECNAWQRGDLAIGPDGARYYKPHQTYLQAEEAECVRLSLDKMGAPIYDKGGQLSLVGRIKAILEKSEGQLKSINAALRGKVNDPDPLPRMWGSSVSTATTYGLVVGLLRERDALLAASPSRECGEAKKSICDFLDAPSMWAQVYCCAVFVRAFTSDMARGAADHAVQEFGSDACKTVADLEYTLDEVLRAD